MRKINKLLISLTFALWGSLSTASPLPQINNDKFIRDYQSIVKDIIREYENEQLDAQIFDINKPHFLNFLTNSTNYKKSGNNDIMGMQYYRNFKVRGKDTSFCFILYDSKSNIVENYLLKSKMKIGEVTEYLALHEMGHCLLIDYLIKHDMSIDNEKKNEKQADMFAVYLLHQNNKNDLIDTIIFQNKIRDKDIIHYNYPELSAYVKQLRDGQVRQFEHLKELIEHIIQLD